MRSVVRRRRKGCATRRSRTDRVWIIDLNEDLRGMKIKTRKFSAALVLALIGDVKLPEMNCFAMFCDVLRCSFAVSQLPVR